MKGGKILPPFIFSYKDFIFSYKDFIFSYKDFIFSYNKGSARIIHKTKQYSKVHEILIN